MRNMCFLILLIYFTSISFSSKLVIGLHYSDIKIKRLENALNDVSDPTSINYGKYKSTDEICDILKHEEH